MITFLIDRTWPEGIKFRAVLAQLGKVKLFRFAHFNVATLQ